MKNKYLICVLGPTAIGKTALSIKLANTFNTEILSADSRQFYKEMNIGTAVPSKVELLSARHHFIQHKSVLESYNVGDFEIEATKKLKVLFKDYDKLILVGGSGLYVDAVVNGLDKFPKIEPGLREKLNLQAETKGLEHLANQLREVDPESYNTIDLNNKHRVIRSLEVCLSSDKPFSSYLSKSKAIRDFKPIKIGLTADRELIYERINQRVDLMIDNGLVKEVESLVEYRTNNALNTVGYKEIFKYLEGEFSLATAISEIKKNTRRFAKRQLTWFNKDETIKWFDHNTDISEIVSYLNKRTNAD